MNGNKRTPAQPRIKQGRGDSVSDDTGRRYLDLNMGYGSVWVGHGNPDVSRALVTQLERYAAPGFLPTEALDAAAEALSAHLPDTHRLKGIYSSGTESIEVALRAACAHTGRTQIVGFAGSMHGKSFVTSALGSAPSLIDIGFVRRLPGFAHADEDQSVAELETVLQTNQVAAVAVEPIQMTAGGHEAPDSFYDTLFRICRRHGVLTIFDETLTGLYRCGTEFYFSRLGHAPDIVVTGKGMANGFPVSAVVARKDLRWDRTLIRPGSTFLNHPLACAVIAATLSIISGLGPEQKVRDIADVVKTTLGDLELRGRGAMWCLGLPDSAALQLFVERLTDRNILVSYYDRYIRLLPALSVELGLLRQACETIRDTYAAQIR